MNFMQATVKTIRIGLTTAAVLAIAAGCASQGSSTASDATVPTMAMNAGADATDSQSVAPVEEKSTKLVCRKIKPTGSRFGERICMRPAQWEKYSRHGRRELEKVQRNSLAANPPGH